MINPYEHRESSFVEGDTVEVLTGGYELMCGDRVYDRETPGQYKVTEVEYEMGEFTYSLVDDRGHTVHDVAENDLRRVTPKRRITAFAIGEGTTQKAFRAALESGPIVFTTGDVGKCHKQIQKDLGDDATVSVWGFDIYVDLDNLPNYWNA